MSSRQTGILSGGFMKNRTDSNECTETMAAIRERITDPV